MSKSKQRRRKISFFFLNLPDQQNFNAMHGILSSLSIYADGWITS